MTIAEAQKIQRINIFGYPVDITTRKAALEFTISHMESRQGVQVVTLNPEIIAAADKIPELANIIRKAELILPESTGIMLAIKSMGLNKAEKIPGIEFSEELMKNCAEKGLKVGFIGAKQEVIDALNIETGKKFPGLNIVFSHHGYFKDENLNEILEKLVEADPHLLFVALGSPEQEFFIAGHRNFLPKTTMIGVGGSFDVWAMKVKRAPSIFRKSGLEWFYRLIAQPSRFSRMFPVLPLFFLRIIFDRKNLKTDFFKNR